MLFQHRQHCFKAKLRQQCLNVYQVETPPAFLVQVAAVDSHVVDEKPVEDGVREIAQSDSVLFGKGQWDAQLQSTG